MNYNIVNNPEYTADNIPTEHWMTDELGLTKTKLKIFALIYNHTVSFGTAVDLGQEYLSNIFKCTRKTISIKINELINEGFILKIDPEMCIVNTGYILDYESIKKSFPKVFNIITNELSKFLCNSYKVTFLHNKMLHRHNNIYINNSNNNIINTFSNSNNIKINNNKYNNNYYGDVTFSDSIKCLRNDDGNVICTYTEVTETATEDVNNNQCDVTFSKDKKFVEKENFTKEYKNTCFELFTLELRETGEKILSQKNLFNNLAPKSVKKTKKNVSDIFRLIDRTFPKETGEIVTKLNTALKDLVKANLEREHKPSYSAWEYNIQYLMDYSEGNLEVAYQEVVEQLAGDQDMPIAKYKIGSTYTKFKPRIMNTVPQYFYEIVDCRCDPLKSPEHAKLNKQLRKYLRILLGKDRLKGMTEESLNDDIDNLFTYSEGNIELAYETLRIQCLRYATTTVPYNAVGLTKTEFEKQEREKYQSYHNTRNNGKWFVDNIGGNPNKPKGLGDMTLEEKEQFIKNELVHNDDGTLAKF